MRLTLEMNGTTHTVSTEHDDVNITQMVELMRGMLVQCGFHPNSVEAMFDHNAIDSWNLEIADGSIDQHQLINQTI